MTQMNLSMKQKQTHGHREQTCGCQGGWGGEGRNGGCQGLEAGENGKMLVKDYKISVMHIQYVPISLPSCISLPPTLPIPPL